MTSGGKRKGAGAKLRSTTISKNHSIKFTDDEWETMLEFARLNRISVSGFIRIACLGIIEESYFEWGRD